MNSKTIPSDESTRARSLRLRTEKLSRDPTCRVCLKTKTVADFPKVAVDYACLECRGAYALRKYHEKRRRLEPDALAALNAKMSQISKSTRARKLAKMTESELKAYVDSVNLRNKLARDKIRDQVYAAYGGYICACCGETERAFLSVDHINNDGAEHRRKLKYSCQFYGWLVRNKFPKGFQILCMNCQWGKRNGRTCPHQLACNDYPVMGVGPSGPKREAPEEGEEIVCSAGRPVAASKEAALKLASQSEH